MTMDEFVDATIDVWDIPTESATRVGHPAPFPVELPRRLIELYTYRGDLVLDPFMGSGSTAVAAVRTERHYVGFDTDESYVALAERRVAEERAAGRSAPTEWPAAGSPWPRAGRHHRVPDHRPRGPGGRCSDRRRGSWPTRRSRPPVSTDIERSVAYRRPRDRRRLPGPGRSRWASGSSSSRGPSRPPGPACVGPTCCGGRWARPASSTRPAPGEPARDDLGPLVLLSTDLPAARARGAKALRAVQGDDRSGPSTTSSSCSIPVACGACAPTRGGPPPAPDEPGQLGHRPRAG